MSNTKTGGPAFPQGVGIGDRYKVEGGMTLRDYFAAKAMQGALASFINGAPANAETDARLAKASYLIADAMLAARESSEETRAPEWKPWYGGACPVSRGSIVEVELQSGTKFSGEAECYDWGAGAYCGPIIAYRILSKGANHG